MSGHVAWLGTGFLGGGFVERLRTRGISVVAWNRTYARAEALATGGVRAVRKLEDAVEGAARVHITLTDDAAVDDVLARVVPVLGRDVVVVDHSTTAPEPTARRAERMQQAGVRFVHAPVFMAPENARAGTGIMMVSAAAELFAELQPELSAMTGRLMHLGARPDLAAVYKLMGNGMIMALIGGLADVLTLARATGVDPVDALKLFETFRPEKQLENRGVRMARGDFSPTFELSMARKDVRLMVETARAAPDLPLVVWPAVAERMDALIQAGHGAEDLGALARDVFGVDAQRGRRKAP